MTITLTNEYMILISKLKTQLKKHNICVEPSKMNDDEYLKKIITEAETLSDLEVLATCEKIKSITFK